MEDVPTSVSMTLVPNAQQHDSDKTPPFLTPNLQIAMPEKRIPPKEVSKLNTCLHFNKTSMDLSEAASLCEVAHFEPLRGLLK